MGVVYPKLKREVIDLGSGNRLASAVKRIFPGDVHVRKINSNLRGQQGFRKSTVTTTATDPNGEVGCIMRCWI